MNPRSLRFRHPRSTAAVFAAVLVSCGASAALAASAPAVTGKFVMDGKPLALGQVAAFRVRDQRNPREFETYVVLSAKPVDKAVIGAALDPYAVAINDPAVMHEDNLSFWVSAKGEVSMNAHVGEVQYVDTSGSMMGQRGSLVATCKENSATRVACSVKSPAAVKSMDGPTWSVDLSFESDVTARAAGKPLPAGGGDPGKALLALRAAVPGKDLAKILAGITASEAEDYRKDWRSAEENLDSANQMLDMWLPKKPKITGGESVDADHAVLEVEGVPYENGKMLYLVEMQRENGKWVFSSSSPVGMLR